MDLTYSPEESAFRDEVRAWIRTNLPDATREKVEELFMWVFARRPSQEHLNVALEHITRNAANKKAAYENLLWALINTKEFLIVP